MSDVAIEIGSEWVEKNDKNSLVILRESKKDNFQIKTGEEGECYISRANLLAHYNLKADMVNHPKHYNDESGVECCKVTDFMMFNGGNSFKYLYRFGNKFDDIEDLKKAKWYAERAYLTDGNQQPNSLQWDQDIREIARYREHGIKKAMTAIRTYSWVAVAAFIENEIARLESEQ